MPKCRGTDFQRDIAIGLPILFNIIRTNFQRDGFIDEDEDDEYELEDMGVSNVGADQHDDDAAGVWRDGIAEAMWVDYQRVLRAGGE
ncbi:hypothetical protein HDU80_001058 [Chytriomyces hyalinus]|nr:hypothetical protein HDU80_001058 [Chytriomyces hyalinus]